MASDCDNRIIDAHAHFLTPEYMDMLARHDATLEDGFPLPEWHVEEHLALMDKCGISWALLSLSSPHPYFESADTARNDGGCRYRRELSETIL